MRTQIKIDLHRFLAEEKAVVVELGCGLNKRKDSLGIDVVDLPSVDIVADLERGLPFLPDQSVDKFYASHVFEHLAHFEYLMDEIHRALKADGKLILRVPHFSNPFYYSDITHKRFFGLYSFEYFGQTYHRFKRKIPRHYIEHGFKTEELQLIFYSDRFILKIVKRMVQTLVNARLSLQEMYEEMWTGIFPCSEIYAVLSPIKVKIGQ